MGECMMPVGGCGEPKITSKTYTTNAPNRGASVTSFSSTDFSGRTLGVDMFVMPTMAFSQNNGNNHAGSKYTFQFAKSGDNGITVPVINCGTAWFGVTEICVYFID